MRALTVLPIQECVSYDSNELYMYTFYMKPCLAYLAISLDLDF